MDNCIIEVKGLAKRFGDFQALKNISFSLQRGQILALLGPNGAGKSTTINCILGFLQQDSGSILVAGFDPLSQVEQVRQSVAYIPEQVALYPRLTGLENLQYMTQMAGLSHTDSEYRILLKQAGLQEVAFNRAVENYSKGMRQKVGIAVALAKNAKALILDEPTSGLDPLASYEFSQLLQSLADQGLGILMATHDLYRAQEDAHQVAIVNRGEIVQHISDFKQQDVQLETLYLQHVKAAETC